MGGTGREQAARRLSTRCAMPDPGGELLHLFVAAVVRLELGPHFVGGMDDCGVVSVTEAFSDLGKGQISEFSH